MTRDLAARYEAAAPRWGRTLERLGFPAAYRRMVDEALRRLPLPDGPLAALDLGAGDGALAEALAVRLGPRLDLTLIDLSPAMLRAAEARLGRGRARLVVGDLANAPLPPGTVDIVAAAHVLEHLAEPERVLERVAAALKPKGIVLLAVSRPHWCSRLVRLLWGHRLFTEDDLRAALERAGFTEVQCWPLAAGPPRRLSRAYAARRPG